MLASSRQRGKSCSFPRSSVGTRRRGALTEPVAHRGNRKFLWALDAGDKVLVRWLELKLLDGGTVMRHAMTMVAVLCWLGATCAGRDDRAGAGGDDVEAMLRIPVPTGALLAKPGQAVKLTDEKGREVQAQVELAGTGGSDLELLLVRPSGLGRTLRVGKAAAPAATAPYAAVEEGRTVAVSANRKPMAVYHVGVRERPGHPEQNRANFFHPLVTPSGATVTDDSPADHLHHRGLFMAFTKATWFGDGRRLEGNFWQADASAVIAPGKLHYARGGPVCATLAVSHDFRIGKQLVLTQDVIARAAAAERAGQRAGR